MADDTIQIDVKTTADTAGLDKTSQALNDVSAAGNKSAQAATASATKHKAFGDALRNLASRNINGAISSLGQLGVKFKDIGGIAMAGGAAVAIWGSNLKKWIGAANEVKKLDIENSVQNTADHAGMLAQNFERSATAVSALAEKEKAMQTLADTTRALTAEIDKQNIANERARELAGVTDDLQREAINIKYDRQLAAVDARSGQQNVAADKARMEQEAADLARQNEILRQGVTNNSLIARRKRMTAQQLGEQGEKELSFFENLEWNRGKRVENAKSYYAKAADEIEGVAGLNQDSRAKLDQVKANEAKIEALKKQIETVIPLKQQLEAAKSTGTDIKIAANVMDSQAAAAKTKEREEADARALADAQQRRTALTGERQALLDLADPAQSAYEEAARASAIAGNKLAMGQAQWQGSRNTAMRDKSLAPLQEQAGAAAASASQAEASLQRTIQTTNAAVRNIDAALKQLDAQIGRLGSRMAAARGDQAI